MGLEPAPLSVSEERQLAILTELPFVVPFEERVKVLLPSFSNFDSKCKVIHFATKRTARARMRLLEICTMIFLWSCHFPGLWTSLYRFKIVITLILNSLCFMRRLSEWA